MLKNKKKTQLHFVLIVMGLISITNRVYSAEENNLEQSNRTNPAVAEGIFGTINGLVVQPAAGAIHAALMGIVSSNETAFSTTVGYVPVNVLITNFTDFDFYASSLNVNSGKIVTEQSGLMPDAMQFIPAHQPTSWQVSSRVGALVGPSGIITYSSTDGESWFRFSWDNPVATGAILQAHSEGNGLNIQHITQQVQGLNGVSTLRILINN